jgi:hypothetical protein
MKTRTLLFHQMGFGLVSMAALLLFMFVSVPNARSQTNTFPASGYVGIGTTLPGFALTAIGTEWNSSQISLTTYAGTPAPGGTNNYTPQFRFEKARGTAIASTKVENGDRIGAFLAAGYDGAKMQRSAVFGFRIDGPTSSGIVPIGFFVQTGNSSANKPERFSVKSDGKVVIKDFAGIGNRMVVTNDTGLLSTMTIPTGGGGPIGLNDLTDVNTAGKVNGSIIKYNGTSWVVSTDNVNDADASPTNELQTLSQAGLTVTLSNGGGSISVADNDNSSTNELQTLSLAANNLSISGGNSVSLAAYVNTDAQTLSMDPATGNLSISNGNTVNVFDTDWLYFSGSGNTGNIYHSGDVALGTFTDPESHGLNVQNYVTGKGAVRGADQSGSSLYAEGLLGILSPTASYPSPVPVVNAGVLGWKPAAGSNGAGVMGGNVDLNAQNYGGLFYSTGAASGGTNHGLYARADNATTNYGVFSRADGGTTNYGGYFEGRVKVDGHNVGDAAADSLATLFSATVNHHSFVDTRAVDGFSVPRPGYGIGMYGTGGYYGVYGFNNGQDYTGTSIGSYGYASGTAGSRYGLYGYAYNPGGNTAIGVYGFASSATNNWAGYFVGDVYVSSDMRIATTNAATGYELSVNGQIACEEVLVQNDASWPDYVFTDEYNLLSLGEVEAHIKEFGYLPNVPSALDIEKNGIKLGEMQTTFMEKIEELTLYTIEQAKQIEKQSQLIEAMQQEIREMKAGK